MTDVVYSDQEIKVEDVPLDEDEQEIHADAMEMFPLDDSKEELRSEHDSEVGEEEFSDESQEEFSDKSHDMSETEGITEETSDKKQAILGDVGEATHQYNLQAKNTDHMIIVCPTQWIRQLERRATTYRCYNMRSKSQQKGRY